MPENLPDDDVYEFMGTSPVPPSQLSIPGVLEQLAFEESLAPNPKQLFGDKKPPLAYIPLSAQLANLEALYDGMQKYGPLNWRENPVEAMTYVEAAMRHLQLFIPDDKL